MIEREDYPMHRIVTAVLIAAALALPAWAHDVPPEVKTFGTAITEKKPVKFAKLVQSPSKFRGKTVRLEGVVKNVCQGAGCWIEVQSAKGETFLAKSLDESVLVPMDCQGQSVVVQGIVTTMPAKPHEHSEEDGHSCPAPTWVVSMLGVQLTKYVH
jgi:hypothetical protein